MSNKALNEIGIQKIGQRFVDSIDHAAYSLSGEPQTITIFRKLVQGSRVRVYVYFNDTISGEIAGVRLIDTDNDIIAELDKNFIKPLGSGLYVAFKYDIEVKSNGNGSV